MKKSTFITLASLIFCGTALADIPVKKPLQHYKKLWDPSPFTTPRAIEDPVTPDNVFKDYHLTGIAPVEGGYLITIANKKDKSAKKIILEPGTKSKFKVLKVERNPNIRLGTVVTLSNGVTQGEVRFEPELVVLNTPVNQNPGQQFPPGFNPNQQNPQAEIQTAPGTAPRSRIVPPTSPNPNQNPTAAPQNPGQNRGQNPGQNRGGSTQNRGGSTQTRPPRTR